MERLVKDKDNVVLRIIDIDKWGSAVASQYRIRSLPTLWLYDGETRVASDARAVFQRISQLQ